MSGRFHTPVDVLRPRLLSPQRHTFRVSSLLPPSLHHPSLFSPYTPTPPHPPLRLTTSRTRSWRMSRVNNAVSISEDADSEESRTNTGRTEMLGFHSSEDGRDYTSDITKRCQLRRHVNENKVDSDSTRIWLKQVGTAASHKPPNPFGEGPSLKTSSRLGISRSPPQCPGQPARSYVRFDLTCMTSSIKPSVELLNNTAAAFPDWV